MKWKKYTRLPDHALRSRACSFIRLEMICSWLSKTEKPPMQHAKRNFNKKKTRWIESERMSNTTTTTKKKKVTLKRKWTWKRSGIFLPIHRIALAFVSFEDIFACVLRLFLFQSGFCCCFRTVFYTCLFLFLPVSCLLGAHAPNIDIKQNLV